MIFSVKSLEFFRTITTLFFDNITKQEREAQQLCDIFRRWWVRKKWLKNEMTENFREKRPTLSAVSTILDKNWHSQN